MKRAAVLGSPVTHSLSPTLHRAAYAGLGLDWTYEAIDCDEGRLPGLLESLDSSWAGLSLTMPLKRAILPLLDEVSGLASAVGGVNTVVFEGTGGNRPQRYGDNTDVGGAADALRAGGVEAPEAAGSTAVLLGGGATAASMVAALAELGCGTVTSVVRDPARTTRLCAAAARLGVTLEVRTFADLPRLLPTDLLVSTLPGGAADPLAHVAGSAGIVVDVCYAPWPTRLAAAAQAARVPVVSGFDFLLYQAVRQVALMTGIHDVPVRAMRAAGERALSDRTP